MKEDEQKPLIAPVKEENRDAQGFFLCPVDNKICWQSNCLHFDDKPTYCGNREEKMKPVPSEQEKQEELWIDVSNVFTVAGHGDAAMKHLERTYHITRK